MNKKTIYNLIVCEDKVKELTKVEGILEFDKHLIISGHILDVTSNIFYLYSLLNFNYDGVIASIIGNGAGKVMKSIGIYSYNENAFKKLILTNIKKD